jgi:hypothetical protein
MFIVEIYIFTLPSSIELLDDLRELPVVVAGLLEERSVLLLDLSGGVRRSWLLKLSHFNRLAVLV